MRPSSLGLPDKYTTWRKDQLEAIYDACLSNKRFVTLNMPTGKGKSLVYAGIAKMLGGRACTLTATKGLQDQLNRDFGESGLEDIRGQQNYHCKLELDEGKKWVMVDQGICHIQPNSCDLKRGGCYFYDAYRASLKAEWVVTNYSFWFSVHAYGEGLGNFDVLILDEAHEAPEQLAKFMSARISEEDLALLGADPPPPTGWQWWARQHKDVVKVRLEALARRTATAKTLVLFQGIREMKALGQKLEFISNMSGDNWIMEPGHNSWQWDPVNVSQYAMGYLFRGIKKVILTSATIRPKTAAMLGIPKGDLLFKEYKSDFPPARRPVLWVPTVQLNYRTEKHIEIRKTYLDRIDQILARRPDRKGIIHTVSYARADFILKNSRYRDRLIGHHRRNTRDVVELFKTRTVNGPNNRVLVSPSLSTGWDFPYQECEFQIIVKVGYPDTRSKVMTARCKADKELAAYLTMVDLVQTVGRGMRAKDDQCETIVVDDTIDWFLRRNGRFAPDWFLESYSRSLALPAPPPALSLQS